MVCILQENVMEIFNGAKKFAVGKIVHKRRDQFNEKNHVFFKGEKTQKLKFLLYT